MVGVADHAETYRVNPVLVSIYEEIPRDAGVGAGGADTQNKSEILEIGGAREVIGMRPQTRRVGSAG
jgi:hypothetical protein